MKPFVGSPIFFARPPGLGRPRRVRQFLLISAIATTLLAALWALVSWLGGHWGLLVGDVTLVGVGLVVLALLRMRQIQAAIHVLLGSIVVWVLLMAMYVSGSGVNHDGAVHYWLFVVIVGLHFVLFDSGRVMQTFYVSLSILVFIVIEYELVPLDPRYGFPEHDRLFAHGLTLGLVFIAVSLIMRMFISNLAEAEQRAAFAIDRGRQLLRSILPEGVAARLEAEGMTFAERYDECTILFADIVGFTPLASRLSPEGLVSLLNDVFSVFDELAEQHGLEKIKTIGDGYMAACGIPTPRDDHARACAAMALDMLDAIERFEGLSIRIGVHSGPVVAGIIGRSCFSYDLWGEAVNMASRMESDGLEGRIQVTREVHDRICHGFELERRGLIDVKGKGATETFFLVAAR